MQIRVLRRCLALGAALLKPAGANDFLTAHQDRTMTTFKCIGHWFAPVLLLAAALLGGCAGVPMAPLHAYSDSFDQAKSAAALVYADAALPLRAGASISNVAYPVSLGSPKFDREGCGPLVASSESLRARCQAMIALKSYNQALLDIAAGKTADDILVQVEQAFNSVTTLGSLSAGGAAALAPLTAAAPALKAILGEALKLRDRAALRSTLERGAPKIRELIQALRDDVDLLYGVQRAYAVGRLDKIQSDIDRDLNVAKKLISNSAAPKDLAVAASQKLLEQRFEAMFDSPEPGGGERLKDIKPAPAGQALDGRAVATVEAQLGAASAHVSKFKEAAAQYNKSIEALSQYDGLLAALDKSLTALLMTSSRPFAAGEGTDQLFQSILIVRDKSRDIKQLFASR